MEKYPLSPYDSSVAYQLNHSNGDITLERFEQLMLMTENVKSHIVIDGDTLTGISYHYYGDPGAWDRIAEANGIMNPLDTDELYEGLVLLIPDLDNIIKY